MSEPASGQFERALEELEKIVARLEREDLTLDDSVELFKKGRELATRCERLLSEAQKTIDLAMKNGEVSEHLDQRVPGFPQAEDTLF
jgi:exodeoxyribonuclease VII small subunit